MKIGLTAYDIHALEFQELARAADDAGFDSLWLGEHVVLPIGFSTAHPTSAAPGDQHHHQGPIVDPETELVDPLVQLGAAAAVTSRLTLATGIYVLPLRHPLATARSACTVQELAEGRFRMGLGFGWLAEEFAALDQPFDQRVSRFEESINVLRTAWRGGEVIHDGKHFSIAGVQVTKRAIDIPLILGGNSDKALRRAARLGDGWFSSGTPSFDEAVRLRAALHHLLEETGAERPFELTFRVEGCDPSVLRQYEDAGFDDVLVWADQVWPQHASLAEKQETLLAAAGRLLRR
jgi:probable F420-dependent oxidoreductase